VTEETTAVDCVSVNMGGAQIAVFAVQTVVFIIFILVLLKVLKTIDFEKIRREW
jgi:hypothetical protein